jgi:hypothetical protein
MQLVDSGSKSKHSDISKKTSITHHASRITHHASTVLDGTPNYVFYFLLQNDTITIILDTVQCTNEKRCGATARPVLREPLMHGDPYVRGASEQM